MKKENIYNLYRLSITMLIMGLMATTAFSQSLTDALRYSTVYPGGTARTAGAGGAFGALGGDFGGITINPASLATYRSSEFTFSPGIRNEKTESILQGSTLSTSNSENHFGLENLGLVLSNQPIASDWYTSNLAIGFNKIANFDRSYNFSGATIGSITERWVELANGLNFQQLDDFEAYPAYSTGAIYDFEEDGFYETDFQGLPDQAVSKGQFVDQEGSINELSLTWAGNYKNKMSIGLGVGIPFLSFEELKTYYEEDPNGEIPIFDDLEYTEYLNTTGTGVNLKAGFIYTPARVLRIGASVQSPTWYFLTDDYDTNVAYSFTDSQGAQSYDESSPAGTFRYRFRAPWIATISAATLYKAGDIQGFVSADLEYKDYSSANYNLTANSVEEADREYGRLLNAEINQELTSAASIRLGTELAYKKLRLRGGVQLTQSAFEADDGATSETLSLGIGVREDKFFIDLGLIHRTSELGYIPYVVSNDSRNQLVINDFTTNNWIVTLGYKF